MKHKSKFKFYLLGNVLLYLIFIFLKIVDILTLFKYELKIQNINFMFL